MALKSKRSTETFQGTRGSGFTKWKKKKKKESKHCRTSGEETQPVHISVGPFLKGRCVVLENKFKLKISIFTLLWFVYSVAKRKESLLISQ